MAKSGRANRGRDLSTPIIQSRSLTPRVAPSKPIAPIRTRPLLDLRQLEDRRTWHPEGNLRKPLAFPQVSATVVDNPNNRRRSHSKKPPVFPGGTLTFAAPDKVVMCVRRQRRKEVLFAKNKTGKSGQKRPRRNFWSNISCKR